MNKRCSCKKNRWREEKEWWDVQERKKRKGVVWGGGGGGGGGVLSHEHGEVILYATKRATEV